MEQAQISHTWKIHVWIAWGMPFNLVTVGKTIIRDLSEPSIAQLHCEDQFLDPLSHILRYNLRMLQDQGLNKFIFQVGNKMFVILLAHFQEDYATLASWFP